MARKTVKMDEEGYWLVTRVAGDLCLPYALRYAEREEIIGYWKKEQPKEFKRAQKYLTIDELIEKAENAKQTLRSMDD